jgi:hypothetical protein
MPRQIPLNGLLERLIQQLAPLLADRVAARMPRSMPAKASSASGKARCAVPGCTNPHSGPRFRFFCRDHFASLGKREQDRILADRRGNASARTARAGRRGASPRKGVKLDMSCRVEGCKNRSGGPRHGFMCKTHQRLSAARQAEARSKWNAAHAA